MGAAHDPPNQGSTTAAPGRRSGWRNWGDHPLVAVVTVLASIAAIAQFVRGGGDKPAPASGCAQVIGRWDWLTTGGVVAIADGGVLYWYRVGTDAVPTITGTWECEERNTARVTFRWTQTSFVDTLSLSEDGQRFTGATTQTGFKLSGTRAR